MPNASSLSPDGRFMALTIRNSDKEVVIDIKDYKRVSLHTWWIIKSNNHSERIVTKINSKKCCIANFILNYVGNKTIDHIDRDIYNNRKCNLREATKIQQAINRSKFENTKFKYKGVRFREACTNHPWKAVITVERKIIELGYFKTEEQAAKVYDRAAKKYHGEFAVLNFPKDK
jgi:hypothetical protein